MTDSNGWAYADYLCAMLSSDSDQDDRSENRLPMLRLKLGAFFLIVGIHLSQRTFAHAAGFSLSLLLYVGRAQINFLVGMNHTSTWRCPVLARDPNFPDSDFASAGEASSTFPNSNFAPRRGHVFHVF